MSNSFLYSYDFNEDIINVTNKHVLEFLEEQLSELDDEDVCKCQECVVDMACLALNKAPQKYRVTLLVSDTEEYMDKIRAEVELAIHKVALNRKH